MARLARGPITYLFTMLAGVLWLAACQSAPPTAAPTSAAAPAQPAATSAPAASAASPSAVSASASPSASPATVASPAASAAAAASPVASAPQAPVPTSAANPSGTLTFAYSADFQNLDPGFVQSTSDWSIMKVVDSGLIERDDTGHYIPGLAESWNQIDDLTWELHLRHGVNFQDGTPFNAQAVKYNLDRLTSPEVNGHAQLPTSVSLDHTDVVDDYTVRIYTKKYAATMLVELYNLGIGSPTWFQNNQLDTLSQHPVGAGPYKFVEWVKDDHLTLQTWDGYWGPKPSIQTITYRIIPELSSRIDELATGGVDIADLIPPDQVNRVQSQPNADVRSVQTGSRAYLAFRNDQPPFDNPMVRQALNYAVNWNEIKASLLNDMGTRLASIVVPPNNDTSLQPYTYDVAMAKQLLTQAGMPNGFTTTITVPCGRYVRDQDIAQAIAANYAEIGVTADVQCVDSSVFINKMFVQKDPYPLAYLALASAFDAQSDLTNLSPTFPLNPSKWTNQQFLDLYNQLIATSDPQLRQQQNFQLQKIVHDDAPYVFLWQQYHWYGVNKKLNWTPRPDEYLYFQFASFQ
jgi:peptide/nickel transport system substrate-binding protein